MCLWLRIFRRSRDYRLLAYSDAIDNEPNKPYVTIICSADSQDLKISAS
jgi:hypothetical protein